MDQPVRTFAPIIEELHAVAAKWEPTNENGQAAAQEMRVLVRELPEVCVAFAAAMRTMGGKCTDAIWMDAGTADLLNGLAEFLTRPVDALRESAQGMDRPHGDDIERIHREDSRAAAWDWERNQGYNV